MSAVIKHAVLTPLTDDTGKKDPNATPLTVQFNPETLEVAARSKLQEEKGEKQDQTPVQVVAGTERSLSIQLIFDETLTGEDVRNKTSQLIAMMQAGDAVLKKYGKGKKDKKVKVPKLVAFEWGNFVFKGVISECNETLDYFSSDGVPLRSSISCTIQERESAFTAQTGANSTAGVDSGLSLPPDTPLPSGPDVQSAIKKNGGESLRDSSMDEIFTVTIEVTEEGGSVRGALGASSTSASSSSKNGAFNATASASAGMDAASGLGASLGGGAGAGAGIKFGLPATAIASGKIGLGAGFELGIGADVGFDAGIGGSLRGGSDLGAGLDLSVGDDLGLDAFAALNPPKVDLGGKLNSGMSALEDLGASFDAGASAGGGAAIFSAKAEVGADVDLGALLFGENDP